MFALARASLKVEPLPQAVFPFAQVVQKTTSLTRRVAGLLVRIATGFGFVTFGASAALLAKAKPHIIAAIRTSFFII